MQPHTKIPKPAAAVPGAAAAGKGRGGLTRAGLALGVLAAAAAGTVLAGAGPAAAAPAVLYAAAAAAGTGDCSTAAAACTLSTALTNVQPGGTIELVTPGTTAHYVGNWTVSTSGTTATAPVTIEAAPGLASQPVLDGNNGNSTGCTTTSCNGPVLSVPAGAHVALSGITIADGDNTAQYGGGGGIFVAGEASITDCTFTGNQASNRGLGGAIDSGDGHNGPGTGTVTVTGSTFSGNTAQFGGAIDSGDFHGAGSVTVTASTFTSNTSLNGGAIDSGGSGGGGSVTVTASTFTGNTASGGVGGAIDSGGITGGGTVTVNASTFTGNTANEGGAIDSGEITGGGTVAVTASTFTGNTAGNDGGAIDSGNDGAGTVTVTASTFTGNTAGQHGNTIDSGDFAGGGSVQVAGDLFDGSCAQLGGTWTDGGYNAGTDTSCFKSPTPAAGDTSGSTVGSDLQTALTGNGGPTQTIKPTTGNPAIGLIPDPTTITLGSNHVALCPAVDQRGYASATGSKCDAGAVQTTGRPAAPVTGLTVTPGYTSLTATWKPSTGATSYQVTVTQHNGSVIKGQATVTGTSARIGGLTPKTTYAVKVLAQPAAPGQKPTVVYATTK